VVLSGNQALDPVGIASYLNYRQTAKRYGLPSDFFDYQTFLITTGHKFQKPRPTKELYYCFTINESGILGRALSLNRGLGCVYRPNGWRANSAHL